MRERIVATRKKGITPEEAAVMVGKLHDMDQLAIEIHAVNVEDHDQRILLGLLATKLREKIRYLQLMLGD